MAWAETFAATPHVKCVLGADITFPQVPEDSSNWTPVTRSKTLITNDPQLRVAFDGNGFTIYNLTINSSEEECGLFGSNYAILQNLKLENVNINAPNADFVGGIAGINNGVIRNCSVSGTINGHDHVGGIAGYSSTTIYGCSSSGSVSGNQYVGGIVGAVLPDIPNKMYNPDGSPISDFKYLSGCHSAANVTGTAGGVGGIAGMSLGYIVACYATGNISGKGDYVGGVTGTHTQNMIACFHTEGSVYGTTSLTGGVGGNIPLGPFDYNGTNYSGGDFTACYWGNNQEYGAGSNQTADSMTKITDGNWENAVNEMNKAIEDFNNDSANQTYFPYNYSCTPGQLPELTAIP